MGARETALKNLEKAHKSPRIGKRGLSKETIDREKAREIYLQTLANDLADITRIQLEAVKAPENAQERMYVLNQAVGKPVERVELEQTTNLKVDV